MNLSKALRVTQAATIAFVGAGGKTTAMFQLAREQKPSVIVTSTTHLGAWQITLSDHHIIAKTPAELQALEPGTKGVILVTGPIEDNKTRPVDLKILSWLREYCDLHRLPLLIEADGSRQKPLKAPADHEPAIPEFIDLVVQVAGLSGLGRHLTEEVVHRAEIYSRLCGLKIGETITPESVASVLLHPEGGLKKIPIRARRVVLLNQAETPEIQAAAGKLAKQLLSAYEAVLVTNLKEKAVFAAHEKVAGILLAAGSSQRYGQTKQLLDWRGEPFVRVVARTAISAGLDPVIIVTGAQAERVEAAINDLPVLIVRNREWHKGQASSIRAGMARLQSASLPHGAENHNVGAAIFLLVDQPQVTPSIISALAAQHSTGLSEILAPLVMDRRTNPVLFDRVTFADLLELKGDVGGRAIFSKFQVEYLPWHDDRLLLDVDTPEQYARLISDETI